MSTSWVSLRPDTEFYNAEITKDKLAEFFGGFDTAANEGSDEGGLPAAIRDMMDQPLAMEALGGMIFYLKSLNMDKDLLSQRSFNVYDPIRKGETMILDGQSLSHLEVSPARKGARRALTVVDTDSHEQRGHRGRDPARTAPTLQNTLRKAPLPNLVEHAAHKPGCYQRSIGCC